ATPVGAATSSTSFTVKATAAPTLSFPSPPSGKVGTTVTITGTNFTGATSVLFNGVASAYFEGLSDTQLKAIVPVAAATGPITVANAMGSAASSASFIVKPKITGFAPAGGSMGTAVTINGNTFTGATAVYFDPTSSFKGTPAAFTVVSDTQISTSVPGGAAASSRIKVVAPQGYGISSTSFAVVSTATPTVNSFSPASGVVGTTVTLTGTNFTGTKAVSLNGTATPNFKGISNTQLAVVVPAGATSGPTTLTNTLGSASRSTSFIVKPEVTGFSPTSGSAGTAVAITGYNFTGATSVTLDRTPTTFTVVSDREISATVPSGTNTGPVSVRAPQGAATSSAPFLVN